MSCHQNAGWNLNICKIPNNSLKILYSRNICEWHQQITILFIRKLRVD
jgi:hypothetical protein